jgi:hypothetical protein
MNLMLAAVLMALQGNGGFELGGAAPEGWSLSGGAGEWARPGHAGDRCVQVTGSGTDSNYWRSTSHKFEPRKTYRVSFWTRRQPAGGGCVITGTSFANRDYSPGPEWARHGFAFRSPESTEGAFLRFGQWQAKGTTSFDDIEIHEAKPFHFRSGGIELGEGESIRAGRYGARSDFGGPGASDWRPLVTHTAGFNSNRWTFGDGQTVVYRHAPGPRQKGATVSVQVGYHQGGRCLVEAGKDGKTFETLGEIGKVAETAFPLPAALFPAPELFVRLRASERSNFQVYSYRYEADLDGPAPDLQGKTRYLEILEKAAEDVEVVSLGDLRPGGDNRLLVSGKPRRVTARVTAEGRSRDSEVALSAAGVEVPYDVRRTGEQELTLTLLDGGKPVYSARVPFSVPLFYAADYGRKLPVAGAEDLGLWWCDAVRKVGRERPLPEEKGAAVQMSAARNEIEAAQIVVRPGKAVRALSAAAGEFKGPKGRIPADRVEIFEVAYVRVENPSDPTGAAGEWADPLPPHKGPIACAAGRNQPLWVQVRVPEDAAAGDYEGTVTIDADGQKVAVPLRLHVWDFALPRTTHVRSGFGFDPGEVKRYHNLQTPQELKEVCDKYYRNFADHRIALYNPMSSFPIRVRLAGTKENPDVEVDFAEFDKGAAYYLDEIGFNAFMLQVQGFPGGTFHERHEGNFHGHRQGSPHYERLMGKYLKTVQDHLEEKGWLKKAYVYWFDEPEPRDYPFVIEGMKLLKRLAPKLTRFLTEEPNEALAGHVELWCPILDAFDPAAAKKRQEKGEEIWWYVCTGPKAPYVGLFIDHDAIEMRMWLWMSWRHGVEGILIWQTNYWTSGTAFPKGALQDPWADPMSYVVGYGVPEGTRQHWGNGDGRFFYPPHRVPSREKILDGPVNSIRWEMLREGIEDYEYFWALRDAVRRKKAQGSAAEKLLEVPPEVFRDLTNFSKDPGVLYRHRALVAEAIERLGR